MSDESKPATPDQAHPEGAASVPASNGDSARKKADKKADKKRKQRVELAGAIIIGIAAVLTALATYWGSQFDGTAQEQSASALGLTLDANDVYNDANAERSAEREWIFSWISSEWNDQPAADILLAAMPNEVAAVAVDWLAANQAGFVDPNNSGIDDPFSGNYPSLSELSSVQLIEAGNSLYFAAQCALFESQVAGVQGDNYGLSTVYLAIALVLGGIAALLSGRAAQTIVLVTASVSLVLGAGVLAYAGDKAEARADAAEELFPFDETGAPLSREGSLTLVDSLCPRASETAETAAGDAASVSDATAQTIAGAAETPPAPATTIADPTTTAPPTTAPLLPPNDFVPTEGGEAVAVYVSVIEESDGSGSLEDDFADAIVAGASLGYDVVIGPIVCDEGATEALDLGDGDYYGAAVYFATVEDATAFADLWVLTYPDWNVAVVGVQTFCIE